jgi:hypothetical protein
VVSALRTACSMSSASGPEYEQLIIAALARLDPGRPAATRPYQTGPITPDLRNPAATH